MRRVSLFGGILFASLFATVARAGEAELAHAIFVKVNGQTISQEQVVEVVRYLVKREFNGVMPEDEEVLDRLQRAALRDLVRSLLIHYEANSQGIRPDRNMRKYVIQQSGLRPEEITVAIRRLLEADDLFSDMMMAGGTPLRDPTPREIKEFYNENRDDFRTNTFIVVRTIFISQDDRYSQAYTKNQAEEMMRQLQAVPFPQRTNAFAAMAREKSEDVFSRFGGLLTGDSPEPWIPQDFDNINPDGSPMFPPVMVEEIRRLNRPGDLRLAVSTEGAHLLYLEAVQGGRTIPWDEAKRIIEYVLKERARNERLRQWLNEVYDRSDVRWHDGTVFEKSALTEILLPSEQQGARAG
ncbi:MAG: peptidyl-prolyl cis-trans isomerase [Planctomycetaceae bacterium]|nr:peptidyl-prolyl cis-trans isomerase [Planctomycetaceae bacterium]